MMYQIGASAPFSLLHVVKIALIKKGFHSSIRFKEQFRTTNWIGWTTIHPAGYYSREGYYYGKEMPEWNVMGPAIRVQMINHTPVDFHTGRDWDNTYLYYDEYFFKTDEIAEMWFKSLQKNLAEFGKSVKVAS